MCYIVERQNIPTLITGWDHSPRSGNNALILTDYTPDIFEKHLRNTFNVLSKKNKTNKKLLSIYLIIRYNNFVKKKGE